MQLPTVGERAQIVTRVVQEWADANRGRAPAIDPAAEAALADNLAGLTQSDALRLARRAVFDDGALGMGDVTQTQAARYRLLNRAGVLSYEPNVAEFADVGGMKRLRDWLQRRRPAFEARAQTPDPPRGVLLLGVQGCGKSLAAKAAAAPSLILGQRIDAAKAGNPFDPRGIDAEELRQAVAARLRRREGQAQSRGAITERG
jgi:SpoVK/Ycf46/Vps4 family AAA+-type ATPase